MTATATVPAPFRSRRTVPLTPMREQAAKSMTKLADSMRDSHPDMLAHQHVRDAARMLRSGNEEAAQRHLRAAMFAMTPQSLMRNGLHTDDAHTAARAVMHGVHRHLLLVKDITDVAAKNQQAIRRDSYGDDATSNPPPKPADPNAGYGPGALAQKPTARQPGGDRAMDAPDRTNSGGSDPAVADPVGPQPKGSKQFATWDEVCAVIELAGPKGYVHGWIKAGPGTTEGAGILTGPHPADKMTVAADKRAAARSLSDADLKAANRELTRRAALLGKPGQQSKGHKAVAAEAKRRGITLAWGWDDLAAVIELSAKTAALEVTPAPYGKPGGPGLYNVKGMKHSDYFENVVRALMTKRGMDKGRASKIAYGALRKWSRGAGRVHPEVRAAAAGALAEEAAKGAAAKAIHGHAVSWDDVAAVVELAYNPQQARVAAGQPGAGRFGAQGAQPAQSQPASTAQQPAQQQQPGAKSIASQTASKSAKATIAKNQQQKQALLNQAAGYGQKIDQLEAQRKTLQQELASASGQTSSGQSGSTTSGGASTTSSGASTTSSGSSTTASNAPAASSSNSSTPSTASTSSTTPSNSTTPSGASTTGSGASTTSSGASTTPSGAAAAGGSAAAAAASSTQTLGQITAQIAQINTQIAQYQKLYAQTMAQAAKF